MDELKQIFEQFDLSGGMTDNPYEPDLRKSRLIKNLYITDKKSLKTVQGFAIQNSTLGKLPTNYRVNDIFKLKGTQFLYAKDDIIYDADTKWSFLRSPSNQKAFNNATENNFVSRDFWKDHAILCNDSLDKPIIIFKDNSGIPRLLTAGLPQLITNPTVTPSHNDDKTYIYYFYRSYTYQVGSNTFEFRSLVSQVLVSDAADMSEAGHYNQVSLIPVLENSEDDNYDEDNVKIKIYRSVNNEDVGLYVGEVDNGVTSYQDTTPDELLGVAIYISDGVYDDEPPPRCKFISIGMDNSALYAGIYQAGELKGNLFALSKQGVALSVPASFTEAIDKDITGIGRLSNFWILFTENGHYRVTGSLDVFGQGLIDIVPISQISGSINHNGIVNTDFGVFYPSKEGFCVTDGYNPRVIPFNGKISTLYKKLIDTDTKRKRIYGTLDKNNKRIVWAVQDDNFSSDNNLFFIYDIENDAVYLRDSRQDLMPTCLYFDDDTGNMIHVDRRGFVFAHSEDIYTDPVVNAYLNPSNWETKAIIYDWISLSYLLNSMTIFKKEASYSLFFSDISNYSVKPATACNGTSDFISSKPIINRNHLIFGDPNVVFGDPKSVLDLDYVEIKASKVHFAAEHGKFRSVALRLTNAMVVIQCSDVAGEAVIDDVLKTVTLNPENGFDFDLLCDGQIIYFDDDNYTQGFIIFSYSDNVITIIDANDKLTSGTKKWQIKGYPKYEEIELLGFSLPFRPISNISKAYMSDDLTENN